MTEVLTSPHYDRIMRIATAALAAGLLAGAASCSNGRSETLSQMCALAGMPADTPTEVRALLERRDAAFGRKTPVTDSDAVQIMLTAARFVAEVDLKRQIQEQSNGRPSILGTRPRVEEERAALRAACA